MKFRTRPLSRPLLNAWLMFIAFGHATAADLRLTSIVRQGDCTTLRWGSRPGEFYTVFWTDNLNPPVFWRVAEVQVPSGGTNTTWSEGGCAQSMMMSGGSSPAGEGFKNMSEEEKEAWREKLRARSEEGIKFLTAKMEEAAQRTAAQRQAVTEAKPDDSSALRSLSAGASGSMKFFRVARTGVAGFVDGLGGGLGLKPAGLSNVISVSASPRYAGVHSLALKANGTVVAWGANGFGQCNVPTNLADVVGIAAGGRHSVAVKRDGSVVS